MKPPCVILAGGRSSRMGGGDKSLLTLNGRSLIRHVLLAVAPQASAVMINTNGDPADFATLGLPVQADTITGFQGPLAGILTGMLWARQCGASHLLSVACDTPFLPNDLATRLDHDLRQTGAEIAVACEAERLHPVIGLWPVALAEQLVVNLRDGKVRSMHRWLDRFHFVATEFASHHLQNINTRLDLEAAQNTQVPAPFAEPLQARRAPSR